MSEVSFMCFYLIQMFNFTDVCDFKIRLFYYILYAEKVQWKLKPILKLTIHDFKFLESHTFIRSTRFAFEYSLKEDPPILSSVKKWPISQAAAAAVVVV